MAITAVADVTYEAWGGHLDPRLPVRVWKGLLNLTGDASAGNISAFLRFNLAGVERLDHYFSLEEYWVDSSATSATTYSLQARNFGSVQTGVRGVNLRVRLEGNSAAVRVGMDMEEPLKLPIFLGQQVSRSTLLEIVTILPNVDLQTDNIWLGGYDWGPRSPSAPDGGISRPNPGLFTP